MVVGMEVVVVEEVLVRLEEDLVLDIVEAVVLD
jgi:hypothetical protein